MKMTTISICGHEYPLRFSLRVVKACEERYGSLDQMFNVMQMRKTDGGIDIVDEFLWLLQSMMDSGARCARYCGEQVEDPPDKEILLDVLDITTLQGKLFAAISGDNARTVEAEPGKNGESAETAQSS